MSSRTESSETPVNFRATKAKLAQFSIFLGITVVGVAAVPSAAFAADFSTYMDTSDLSALSNGLAWYALLTSLVGMLISAMLWWSGSQSNNSQQNLMGKNGFIVCCSAAFLVGATPTMVSWLEGVSHRADVDKAGVTSAQPYSGGQMNPCGSAGVSATCSPSGNLNPNVGGGGTGGSMGGVGIGGSMGSINNGPPADCVNGSGNPVPC